MDDRFAAAWALLPGYLSQHVLLSLCALTLGFAISLPLGVAASRSVAVRWPSLFVASLIQTIPSLALLAMFYPLLLALSAVSQAWFGRGFPALGFAPSSAASSGAVAGAGDAEGAGTTAADAERRAPGWW